MRQVTANEKYRAVKSGILAESEFVRQMKLAFPQFLTSLNGYKDTVQILKNYNVLSEDHKNDDYSNISDDSIRRGLDVEIAALGHDPVTCDDAEVQEKARARAIANIKKDPLHYYNLLAKESSKVDKHDKYTETKRGKLEKDTFNDMKKATLKEMKQNLVEGTRALVGYLSGDTLTTTYNHYDGYPSNLGVGLEKHYNDDDKAKDVAMKGYITYLNPDTGEIEATHNDAPGKIKLPEDAEQRAREIAEEIDKFGADYGYIWVDEANMWTVVKNTGIRSMIDQIVNKISELAVDRMGRPKIDSEPSRFKGRDKSRLRTQSDDQQESMYIDDEEWEAEMGRSKEDTEKAIDAEKDKLAEVDPIPTEPGIPGERASNHDRKMALRRVIDFLTITGHPESGFKVSNQDAIDFIKTHRDDIFSGEIDAYDINDVWGNYDEYEAVNRDSIEEKKGKDHDGDGDVDGDDYMAAKDKAIKKAMGKDKKDIKEAVKNIITKVLEEQVLNEAATQELARIADEYGDFGGLKSAVIDLQNIVTDIESFYDKTREKIQKAYNALGEITNEEGLKVGAFIAPSIENAFRKDMRHIIKGQFTHGLELPKVRQISQADVDRGYVQQEAPKQSVFTPVNEKKK